MNKKHRDGVPLEVGDLLVFSGGRKVLYSKDDFFPIKEKCTVIFLGEAKQGSNFLNDIPTILVLHSKGKFWTSLGWVCFAETKRLLTKQDVSQFFYVNAPSRV